MRLPQTPVRPVLTRRLLVLCSAALLAACASKPPAPATLNGTIQASAQSNPNESKRPSPLMLRVYELKTAAAFNRADFMSLYQRDQAELAADVVGREEYVLQPGETRRFTKPMAAETRYVGVIAAYRDLEHAKWRAIVAVQPTQSQQVLIQAGALSVEASVTAPAK